VTDGCIAINTNKVRVACGPSAPLIPQMPIVAYPWIGQGGANHGSVGCFPVIRASGGCSLQPRREFNVLTALLFLTGHV